MRCNKEQTSEDRRKTSTTTTGSTRCRLTKAVMEEAPKTTCSRSSRVNNKDLLDVLNVAILSEKSPRLAIAISRTMVSGRSRTSSERMQIQEELVVRALTIPMTPAPSVKNGAPKSGEIKTRNNASRACGNTKRNTSKYGKNNADKQGPLTRAGVKETTVATMEIKNQRQRLEKISPRPTSVTHLQ